MKRNKNLGENRKESQLPIKSRGCNKTQGFRGNCDSKGKLGMCPSLAEPDSGGFPRTSRRRNKKFFDPTIFQKCCRGVGEQPTFAKQITELHNEIQQKSERKSEESQLPLKSRGCKYGIRFQGQLRFPRQAGDVPQPCRIR